MKKALTYLILLGFRTIYDKSNFYLFLCIWFSRIISGSPGTAYEDIFFSATEGSNWKKLHNDHTGYFLSEELFLHQLNQNMTTDCYPNYEFISKRKLQVQYMVCTSNCSECQKNPIWCTHHVLTELVDFLYWTRNSMNNLLSLFGLIGARMSASDQKWPLQMTHLLWVTKKEWNFWWAPMMTSLYFITLTSWNHNLPMLTNVFWKSYGHPLRHGRSLATGRCISTFFKKISKSWNNFNSFPLHIEKNK